MMINCFPLTSYKAGPIVLTKHQIAQFVELGYVQIPNAFPQEIAAQGRNILWKACGCDPHDPQTWTSPVIRLGDFSEEPFRIAVNTPLLLAAFDQLAGKGCWLPRQSLGTFPLRFPHPADPGDTGWHVDASFPSKDPGDIFSWRINLFSRGRALLMLFLFSDVGADDAPTCIRAGSHLKVARVLQPFGADGLSFAELSEKLDMTDGLPEVLATGAAGTVYLCHPFLVHAARRHRGGVPRFMAQPPLYASKDFEPYQSASQYPPVAYAIRLGLGLA